MLQPRHVLHTGDWVVYRKHKRTEHPGPRARHVYPDPRGDSYDYDVDKYWIVEDPDDHGEVVMRTRTGKSVCVPVGDRRLRRASMRERFVLRSRFPDPALIMNTRT